jgi:transcriptional repressor NrdR
MAGRAVGSPRRRIGYPRCDMQCPFCVSARTLVVDSRPIEAGSAIRRRRLCEGCGNRFTTYERSTVPLVVRKRDGRLEPFQVEKIRAGFQSALADRPVNRKKLEAMIAEVESLARSHGSRVDSDEIGRAVLTQLRNVDEVAYLRFASVYKEFQGAQDFEREMATLEASEESAG